jgi:hypothetical protein
MSKPRPRKSPEEVSAARSKASKEGRWNKIKSKAARRKALKPALDARLRKEEK